jgi:glycosyl transferase family 92
LGRFLEYAAWARANPNFDFEERQYRLDIGQRMRGMLDGASEGSMLVEPGIRTVFRGKFGGRHFSLTGAQQNNWLHQWALADGESLMRGLAAFTDESLDAEGRFAVFAREAEEAWSAGTLERNAGAVVAFGSLFNSAVDPERLPVVRAELFERLEQILGDEYAPEASPTEQYGHHLALARRLREEMEGAGIPIRDMIDAESLIRVAAEEHELWGLQPAAGSSANGRTGAATAGGERDRPYLSVCGVYRDEAPYLREWIEFHRLVGVERFFLYDNKSSDEHLEVLEPYLENGIVILHDWPVFPAGQHAAYEHCLVEHREDSRWIAFIDLDEFLFSPTHRPVTDVLAGLERWPGVGVNSVFFGTSGHRTRPAGLVIENYLENDSGAGKNAIKSIIDPRRTARCDSVHSFTYVEGTAVNEHGYPIHGHLTKSVSHSILRINHYWAKSEEQFRAKCAQPGAANGYFRPWYDMSRLAGGRLNDESYAIAKYAPALREALAQPAAAVSARL